MNRNVGISHMIHDIIIVLVIAPSALPAATSGGIRTNSETRN